MSHNITEVDTFTTPVVVPDGTDDHMLLSSYILAFVQALTNRSLNAKNLHTALDAVVTALAAHAALTDASNTFTVAPQKVNDNNANRPVLSTDKTCQDDPTSPNLWKRLLEFPTPDAGQWRLYSGQLGGDEQYAITANASWAAGAQHWVADDTGQGSLALTMSLNGYEGFRIARRPAGAGSWTDWNFSGGGSGSLIVNNQILATDIAAAHAVLTPTPTDADESQGFQYSDANWRPLMVPLFSALGGQVYADLFSDGFRAVYQANGVLGIGDMVAWPLSVPPGCHIGEIRVRHIQSSTITGGNDDFLLLKRSGLTGNWSAINTTTAAGGGGVAQTTAVHTGGDETVETDAEYALQWVVHNTDPTLNTHRIRAIEIDVLDVGPRNKVN
jgi:hypothetical protein